MPLRQGRGVYQTDDALVFMMRDTQTGEVVPCKISAAALSRLAGRPGVGLEDAFDENRLTIEAIASRMYDVRAIRSLRPVEKVERFFNETQRRKTARFRPQEGHFQQPSPRTCWSDPNA